MAYFSFEVEAIAERIRYERFASSFDYVPATSLKPATFHRLIYELTYQYKPLWLVGLPLFFSIFGMPQLYAGLRRYPNLAKLFRDYIFWGPTFELMADEGIGVALFLETVLRIAGESIWRFYGLDTSSSSAECRFPISASMGNNPSDSPARGHYPAEETRRWPSLKAFLDRFPNKRRQ